MIYYEPFQRETLRANGSIAQLGEHLPYKQRVIGSSPIVPTKNGKPEKVSYFMAR